MENESAISLKYNSLVEENALLKGKISILDTGRHVEVPIEMPERDPREAIFLECVETNEQLREDNAWLVRGRAMLINFREKL